MPPSEPEPFSGPDRKLVVALDIGTTYSGVSYSILDPGKVPEVRGVTHFPAQEHVGGESKIPSVLYYDKTGKPRAIGAETLQEEIVELAEEEKWEKVEWFKLHLRPRSIDTDHMKKYPLPKNKKIGDIYADFLKYLVSCTKTYIEDTHASGQALWDSVKDDIEYVITHPNGWERPQQAQLRRAAAEAGLVPNSSAGQSRIQFLTEGEASLHFCAHNSLSADVANTPGKGIIIIDAGGGTVDVSAYAAIGGGKFEEITVADCHFQGSVFVTERAREFMRKKFTRTNFITYVSTMASVFDCTAKLRFRSESEKSYIQFGGRNDTNAALDIRNGKLTLKGTDVAGFFRPSIDAMIEALEAQRRSCHRPISNVFLVGGFGASDFVFSTLKSKLDSMGLVLNRPDKGQPNKAVADGAMHFYLNRAVSTRVARFDYGTECGIPFHPILMMLRRSGPLFKGPDGTILVPGHFGVILEKDTQVSDQQTFSCPVSHAAKNANDITQAELEIKSYRGEMSPSPMFINMDEDNFITHCKITGDLTAAPKTAKRGPNGDLYYEVEVEVNITFGPAEIEAYLSWDENGEKKRGPAKIVYDESVY